MRDFRDELRRRVAAAGLPPARETEIVDELCQHLDDRRAELLAGGATSAEVEVALAAELDEGGALARELARILPAADRLEPIGTPRPNFLAGLYQDLRYAARSLAKSRGFTVVTLLSLALGIGANSAIFGLVDALRLRPLPVRHPEELAFVQIKDRQWASGHFQGNHPDLSNPLWEQIKQHQEAFSSIGAWSDFLLNTAPSGMAKYARGIAVSGGFFDVVGVPPYLGRGIQPADDTRGCGLPVAVASYDYWQRELGGDPGAIGRTLSLERHGFQLVGVMPRGFHGLDVGHTFDVAFPLCAVPLVQERSLMDMRHGFWLAVVGRLKPGWTLERAATYLEAGGVPWFEATTPNYSPDDVKKYLAYRMTAVPASTGASDLRKTYSTALYLLLGTAALVLLIACANLANLLLARASVREREIAVRLALGASRGRLIRQLMTESLLLAVVGAVLGLLLARGLGETVVSYLSTRNDPTLMRLDPDWRVLAFTVGLAVLTCVLFGLAPALRASRTDVGLVLRAVGNQSSTAGRVKLGLRRVLVGTQVALSFILLVGSLLFARSLANLVTVDTGFRSKDVLIATVDLRPTGLGAERSFQTATEIREHLMATPLVSSAAITDIVPLGGSRSNDTIWPQGKDGAEKKVVDFSAVSSSYFATLGIPLVAGRDIDSHDVKGRPLVGVVNQAFVREVTGGENPIGRTFDIEADPGSTMRTFEIVGIAGDTKYRHLNEKMAPIVYMATAQDEEPSSTQQFLIRSSAPPAVAAEAIRKAVADVAPEATIDLDVFDRMIEETLLRERLLAALSGFFGLLAVILVSVGLYGVVSYAVARRTREIGIRIALGASKQSIMKMVVGDALSVVAVGALVGAGLAIAAAQAARALLYGLAPHDPMTFVVALAVLGLVAAFASLVPARRAARVEPMVALRDE